MGSALPLRRVGAQSEWHLCACLGHSRARTEEPARKFLAPQSGSAPFAEMESDNSFRPTRKSDILSPNSAASHFEAAANIS